MTAPDPHSVEYALVCAALERERWATAGRRRRCPRPDPREVAVGRCLDRRMLGLEQLLTESEPTEPESTDDVAVDVSPLCPGGRATPPTD